MSDIGAEHPSSAPTERPAQDTIDAPTEKVRFVGGEVGDVAPVEKERVVGGEVGDVAPVEQERFVGGRVGEVAPVEKP